MGKQLSRSFVFMQKRTDKYISYSRLIWVAAIAAILFNLNWYFYSTDQGAIDNPFFHLAFFENIRYGRYIAWKFFLPLVSFIILTYLLIRNQTGFLVSIKKNLYSFYLLAVSLVLARIFSFRGWFIVDDYRIINQHIGSDDMQALGCCGTGYYPIGLIYLVIRWFGINYDLYQVLGITLTFVIGITIILIGNKLQKNSKLSLLVAIFFATTTTYFNETISAFEITGNTFTLLLFSLSLLSLVFGAWPVAVTFAASALEFGFTRSHFIFLPLFFAAFLLIPVGTASKKAKVFGLGTLLLLTLVYASPTIKGLAVSVASSPDTLTGLFLIILDMVVGVALPIGIAFPVFYLLQFLTFKFLYTSIVLGAGIIIGSLLLMYRFFKAKEYQATKIVLVGLVIMVSGIFMPAVTGSRVFKEISSLSRQYVSDLPTAATAYGLFSSYGVAILILGLGIGFKSKWFNRLLFVIVIINIITFARSTWLFTKEYTLPQRNINAQLNKILPRDGQPKIILMPPSQGIFNTSINLFQGTFRINEKYIIAGEEDDLAELIEKNAVSRRQIYFLQIDENKNVMDLSSEKLPGIISKMESGLEED